MAGSLKRELQSKHGITPKMKHAKGEIEIFVDGKSVYSYKKAQRIPTVEVMIAAMGLTP